MKLLSQLSNKRGAMKYLRQAKAVHFKVITFVNVAVLILQILIFSSFSNKDPVKNDERLVSGANDMKYPFATNYERKDWHDYEFINYEASRRGPGEQGEPHELTDAADIARNEDILNNEGLYGVVSDQISVNRSLPDPRMPE